eukprot:TRINITY_DN10986_c0_g1_i6.p1 TRINITY_DN10986_c0_g1~~TRINITY_DN10986_c0_g1_i6.p1  ORF type:complete len:270 (+),score=37.41 TRINITY_DN10986_c0_g1_i6:122-931(+)
MTLRATPPPSSGNLTEDLFQPRTKDLMSTTNQINFQGAPEKRPDPRPTSNTRHNNPQAQSFRSQVLPSGEVINVSMRTDVDGRGAVPVGSSLSPGESEFKADSTFRSSFKKPSVEPWQQSNTARYGMREQPWAQTHRASTGIVPTVIPTQMDALAKTTTTTHDSFSTGTQFNNRFSSTSSRRAPTTVDDAALDSLKSVVKSEALPAIESWLRSAPGFEGEVVKRMINCVSRQVTPQSQGPLGQTEPDKREQTPELDAVSKWGGPVTSIV